MSNPRHAGEERARPRGEKTFGRHRLRGPGNKKFRDIFREVQSREVWKPAEPEVVTDEAMYDTMEVEQ